MSPRKKKEPMSGQAIAEFHSLEKKLASLHRLWHTSADFNVIHRIHVECGELTKRMRELQK